MWRSPVPTPCASAWSRSKPVERRTVSKVRPGPCLRESLTGGLAFPPREGVIPDYFGFLLDTCYQRRQVTTEAWELVRQALLLALERAF